MTEAIGIMDAGFFVGRGELIQWVNTTFDVCTVSILIFKWIFLKGSQLFYEKLLLYSQELLFFITLYLFPLTQSVIIS